MNKFSDIYFHIFMFGNISKTKIYLAINEEVLEANHTDNLSL